MKEMKTDSDCTVRVDGEVRGQKNERDKTKEESKTRVALVSFGPPCLDPLGQNPECFTLHVWFA